MMIMITVIIVMGKMNPPFWLMMIISWMIRFMANGYSAVTVIGTIGVLVSVQNGGSFQGRMPKK